MSIYAQTVNPTRNADGTLMQMRIRAQNMEGSKLGRWLGWAQCAVVAAGVGLTLDDMKTINQRCMTEGRAGAASSGGGRRDAKSL
ncbi:Uncharacterised protein [Mycobacteroides abscessus subsp. abscessus]|uniref:hypothetical protein n=1 Tax=Mycobacteroides abscessus TaxID=36809 RepID=UPI0009C85E12|nr:hypothetical protein [Mycobacteroides abscessus]SLJ67445.1 Uncharacterised protein [Mycobacteroides abscessus subsp. abscessus]